MNSTKEVIPIRVLLVSSDITVIEAFCHFGQMMAIHFEVRCDVDSAKRKLCHEKVEGLIVDLDNPGCIELLKTKHTLTSNRSAISFAILGEKHKPGEPFPEANFVVERQLLPGHIFRLLKASYSMMVQERRRYFRCPLQVSVIINRGSDPEFEVTSLNVSEAGICLNSSRPVQVGDRLRLRFRLPDEAETLNLNGEVCWSEALGRVGLQFLNPSPQAARTLRSWLAERLEETLLETRDHQLKQ